MTAEELWQADSSMSSLECSDLVVSWISCAKFGGSCQWKMKSDERKKKRSMLLQAIFMEEIAVEFCLYGVLHSKSSRTSS
jgi:hypothetical protein